MAALAQYAPGAISALNKTAPETAATQASIDQSMQPIYNDLYNKGQIASSNTEADIAEGPGKRLVSAADAAQRSLDPEYYSTRATMGNAINSWLGSGSPTGALSPTEEAELSRGVAQTNGVGTPSALTTASNAMKFGQAATNKWQAFGDAITKASSAIPTLKSGVNGFDVSQTRGANPLPSNSTNALGNNFGFANNALGNISSSQRTQEQIADSNSPIKLMNQSISSL